MNTEKLIQIIESCLTYEQFLTARNIVERHIFTSERECNIVFDKLTEKENQLKTQTNA